VSRTLAVLAILLAAPAYSQTPDDAPTWHLLTQSEGGTVSLVKGLTKHECEFARARTLGLPATPAEEEAAYPICPPLNTVDSEIVWATWHRVHPAARGCNTADGNRTMSWTWGLEPSFGYSNPGNIKSAECFQ